MPQNQAVEPVKYINIGTGLATTAADDGGGQNEPSHHVQGDTAPTPGGSAKQIPVEEGVAEVIYRMVPEVGNHFTILSKIGEGAFSTVYKARLKNYPEVKEMFALKVIIPTTHPSRVENELRCLLNIGNVDNVMGVNLCLRHRDHVVIVMPYFPHDKFQEYIPVMSVSEAREYMRNLLLALRRVHHFQVIHRDIKPSNFLYSREANKYTLVDFGLASGKILSKPDDEKICDLPEPKGGRENAWQTRGGGDRPDSRRLPLSPSKKDPSGSNTMLPPPPPPFSGGANSRPKVSDLHPRPPSRGDSLAKKLFVRNLASTSAPQRAPQYCDCFGRPVICQFCVARQNQVAPRAGTAGFRAPEVLMKSPQQDTGVDMWSAGVIFLSVLSGRYPFFRAQDDMGYLAQIISVLGTQALVRAARTFDKELTVSDNIPPVDLKTACLKLRANTATSKGTVLHPSWEKISDFPFDLLKRMLDPTPSTRITAEDALKHPWFTQDIGGS